MAVVRIQIAGRMYEIACDDGQEDHLRLLADEVNERVCTLIRNMGTNPGEVMALLLSSLTMADELLESKKGNSNQVYEAIAQTSEEERRENERRMAEMESAMARTLNEVASRIEAIAQQIEIS
jgi:cell division protein ZapA